MDPVKENSAYQAAPPRYRIATALALLVPFLCYTSIWCSAKPARALVLCLIAVTSTLLLVELKRYFGHLNQVMLLRPVSRMMISGIVAETGAVALVVFPVNSHQTPITFLCLLLIIFLSLLLNIYAGMTLGARLQDLGSKNDNNFLALLGIAYRYIIPAVFMFTLIVHYSDHIDPVYFSLKYTWLRVIATTLVNIPNLLSATMFFIAGKEDQNTLKLSTDIPIS